jgi:hypothetical protein
MNEERQKRKLYRAVEIEGRTAQSINTGASADT